ncbi:TonB-dependent receptor [Phenylobacterium sp. Root700]|uniref:TonB-dependent receptor n=1 Tax=Phenylobacterium sp. Root700 TaxID=1736591 RepID=UPI0009EB5C4B|nr:TonB-dependent receptor [Phenylobacterium sp. Root700]
MSDSKCYACAAAPADLSWRRLRWAALAGVSMAALIAPCANAADATARPSNVVEELIVTAQKREESINSVPMSITAASGEQLARQGISEPRDLVKLVPGFTFAQSNTSSPIYTLRGIGFVDISVGGRPTVSIYTDEAPIPFAIETRGTSLDVERVEVLKGPQGTLFGQNATGGAINFVAAKPTDFFKAGADVSYGRFNTIEASGFVSGPITDTLLARVAVQRKYSDDWQKSYTRNDANGREDFSNGRVLLDWTPTDNFRAQLNVNGWIDRSDTQATQLIAIEPTNPAVAAALLPQLLAYPLSPETPRAADWTPNRSLARKNKFFQTNLRLDYTLPNEMTLTSLTSYNRFTIRQPMDVDGTSLRSLDLLTIGHINAISEELRLAGDLFGRGHFVVGASYANDKVLQSDFVNMHETSLGTQFVFFGLPRFETLRSQDDQRAVTRAVFASVDYDLTSTVTLNAGARYTKMKDEFNGCSGDTGDGVLASVFGPFWNILRAGKGLPPNNPTVQVGGCATADENYAPVTPRIFNTLKEDNVSWRAGAEWKPIERTLIYANVSKGYKAGGFPITGATQALQFLPATQESVVAYEVGFKATLLEQTLQLNGATFYYDYRDKQILGRYVDPVLGPLFRLVNVPKSDVRGAELQAIWAPVRGLTVHTGVSYINSRVLGGYSNFDEHGQLTSFDDEAFPNTPKWQFVSDVNYTWSLTDKLDGFVGGGATYQSASNSQLGELPLLRTKAYTLVDLRAGVETTDGRWRVSAWGRNIFDTYYWSAATHTNDTTVRFAGKPATYGVALTYRFD